MTWRVAHKRQKDDPEEEKQGGRSPQSRQIRSSYIDNLRQKTQHMRLSAIGPVALVESRRAGCLLGGREMTQTLVLAEVGGHVAVVIRGA